MIATPEQLKAEKAERDSVLAELLLSERKNKDLTESNDKLTLDVTNKTQEVFLLDQKISDRNKILSDVIDLQTTISKLKQIQSELSNSILKSEEDIGMQSWVAKRDELLKNVSELESRKENLSQEVIDLADSLTDIEKRVNFHAGELSELKKQDKNKTKLISKELADLEKEKNTLIAQNSSKREEMMTLNSNKEDLVRAMKEVGDTYTKITENIGGLEKMVSNARESNGQNASDLISFFGELKNNVQDIIEINKNNVTEAQKIISRLPNAIIDLQKKKQIIRPILSKKRHGNGQ